MSRESSKQQTPQESSKSDRSSEQRVQTSASRTAPLLLQRAYADPSSLTPTDVKHLQRTIGNRAVIGLLSRSTQLQAKLKLGPAGDQYEQEANRVAQQVVRQMDRPQPVQRTEEEEELAQAKPFSYDGSRLQRTDEPHQNLGFVRPGEAGLHKAKPLASRISQLQRTPSPRPTKGFILQRQEEEEEEAELQMKPMHGPEGGAVEHSVERQIQSARGGGKAIDDTVRGSMEQGFGADFSNVRIHTGGEADTLNRSLNARAFTVGSDVFFRRGEYSPGSSSGKQLLAHELTHTIQQTGTKTVQPKRDPVTPVLTGFHRQISSVSPNVQRMSEEDFRTLKYEWLKDKAARQNQTAVYNRLMALSHMKQMLVLREMTDAHFRGISLADAKRKLKVSSSQVDWERLSEVVRSHEEGESVGIEPEGSKVVEEEFSLKELSYNGFALFLQQVLGLHDEATVASLSASFTFKVGVSAGIPNILEAAITPYITLGGTINIGDDRRLRVGASLEFGAESELNILQLWKIHAKVGAQFGIVGVFEDEKHLAAFVIAKISKLLSGFRRIILAQAKERGKKLTKEEINAINEIALPDLGSEGFAELSEKGASVTTASAGITAEVGTDHAETFSASIGATGTRTTFYKDDKEGNRVKKQGTTRVFTFKVGFDVSGFGFEAGVTRSIIENDGNPDNNGDYLNVKLVPKIPLGEPVLEQLIVNMPAVLAPGADMVEILKRSVKTMLDPFNLATLAEAVDPSGLAIEFNMVSREPTTSNKAFVKQLKDGDYFLQYARLTSNFSKEFDFTQDIPTPVPGLNVALGQAFKLERTVGTAEFLGSKTLSYIQTVYDGLLNRGRRGLEQWERYRDAHKNAMYKMLLAVGDPSSPASAEAKGLDTSALASELGSDKLSKARSFVSICEGWFNPEKLKEFDLGEESGRRRLRTWQKSAMVYFDAYLEATRLAGKAADADTWRRVTSGSLTARLVANRRPFKPMLERVKIDSGEPEKDDSFPRTLREGYEEGFRTNLELIARHEGTQKDIELNLKYQKPDQPAQVMAQKIYSKGLHQFTKFPMGMTILEESFYSHAEGAQRVFDTTYRSHRRLMTPDKAITAAKKARQQFWEKKLNNHVTKVTESILDAEVEHKES